MVPYCCCWLFFIFSGGTASLRHVLVVFCDSQLKSCNNSRRNTTLCPTIGWKKKSTVFCEPCIYGCWREGILQGGCDCLYTSQYKFYREIQLRLYFRINVLIIRKCTTICTTVKGGGGKCAWGIRGEKNLKNTSTKNLDRQKTPISAMPLLLTHSNY